MSRRELLAPPPGTLGSTEGPAGTGAALNMSRRELFAPPPGTLGSLGAIFAGSDCFTYTEETGEAYGIGANIESRGFCLP